MRRAAAVIALSLVFFPAKAAPGATPHRLSARWQPVGATVDGRYVQRREGLTGRVSAVAALGGNPPAELVGTLGGIWKRVGRGRWRDVTDPSWPSTAVNSFAVDPTDPRVVYAGTGYDVIDDSSGEAGAGVLKSTDGGDTWVPLAATEAAMRGYAVTGLAVYPLDPRIVVAATNNGVFRTADGGVTWAKVLPLPSGSHDVAELRLAVDPTTGELLAGVARSSGIVAQLGSGTVTSGHAIFRSNDAGHTWTAYAIGSDTDPGLVLAPAIATTLGHTYAYAVYGTDTSGAGIYTSNNGGSAWQQKTAVEAKASIAQIVADPRDPTRAYFGIANGPFEYDWGATSAHLIAGLSGSYCHDPLDFRALSIAPARDSSQALYGGVDGGTCFYDMHTRTFTNNSVGLVSGIDYSGAARSPLFELSGAQDLGVDAYTGSTARELYDADAYGVLIDRNRPRTYYAAILDARHRNTFVVSHDAGASWSVVGLPTPASDATFSRPLQASGDPSVVLLPQRQGPLYVSTNDGRSWNAHDPPINGGDYVTSTSVARVANDAMPVIYLGTGFGRLWRSPDLGASWHEITIPNASGLSVRDIAINVRGSRGPGAERIFVALGVYAPQAYATTTRVGAVLKSSDSGDHWADIAPSLGSTSVNALLVRGATLLAGTNHGIEQDVGGHWSAAGQGFPHVRVTDLFESDDKEAVFATTYGRGTWRVITPTLSALRIRAFLHGRLRPPGPNARIGSLLTRRGLRQLIRVPIAGRLVIRWYARERTSKGASKRVVFAVGRRTFLVADRETMGIRLTSRGARLLSKARRLTITVDAVITPAGRPAVHASARIRVKR